MLDAVSALDSLDSYRSHTDFTWINPINEEQMVLMSFQMVRELIDGEADVIEAVISYPGEFDEELVIILAKGRLYLADQEGEWQVLEGEMASAMLDTYQDSRMLNREFIETLILTADCTASDTRLRKNDVKLYSYSNVNFAELTNRQGMTFADTGLELRSADMDIWLLSDEEITIPIKFELDLQVEQLGTGLKLRFSEQILDINVPFEIEIPDVASPSFFLDLPLPKDSYILLENEGILFIVTLAAPDDVIVFYDDYFAENGWVEGDLVTREEQGVAYTGVEYSKAEQVLTVMVGEQDYQTLVIIARDEGL